jgi:flagellar hook-basal body complex protein FliE
MTMIPPIQPITPGIRPIDATSAVAKPGEAAAADPTGGFGDVVSSALDNLDQAQKQTDELSKAAATGDLSRVEDLMIATNQTQLMTQLTVSVRNRAVEAFTEIMRMQV